MGNLLEILVGQLPEAIYFALFLIFTKELKHKRCMFILLVTVDYILMFKLFPTSIWARIAIFAVIYLIEKIIYKDKAQIIDIFTLGIASILLILIDLIMYAVMRLICNKYMVYVIVCRIIMFLVLYLLRNKLPSIQSIYKKLWNRNDKVSKKIKSTTFRALNTVIFNIMFVVLNVGIVVSLFLFGR